MWAKIVSKHDLTHTIHSIPTSNAAFVVVGVAVAVAFAVDAVVIVVVVVFVVDHLNGSLYSYRVCVSIMKSDRNKTNKLFWPSCISSYTNHIQC